MLVSLRFLSVLEAFCRQVISLRSESPAGLPVVLFVKCMCLHTSQTLAVTGHRCAQTGGFTTYLVKHDVKRSKSMDLLP